MITISKVRSKKEKSRFIDFPHSLYQDDNNYVPSLYVDVEAIISKNKNPFFFHSEVDLFLAYREDIVIGRIAVILNNNYNDFHNTKVGFFGFFDAIDDYDVFESLLNKASSLLMSKGCTSIIGPTNLTTNDTAGLLIHGYSRPPVIEMTYNKAYYKTHIERYGFQKDMDLYAYWLDSLNVDERVLNLSESLEKRLANRAITFRSVNKKQLTQEANRVWKVYSSCWQNNWGFVPPTYEEFVKLANNLKDILNPEYCFIAEHGDKIIGFVIALPNMNEIMIDIPKGRLFPTGLIKLLAGRKKVKTLRIFLLGVLDEYRLKGIDAIFYAKLVRNARKNNIIGAEASWILENNTMMRNAIEKLNGSHYKTYRMYRMDI